MGKDNVVSSPMGEQLGIEVRTPSRYPDDGKRCALESARRQLGNQLFEFLWKNKLPAVIDIEEQIEQGHPDNPMAMDVIRYRVTATPVQHRHVVMTAMSPMDFRPIKNPGIFGRLANWLARLEVNR